MTRRFRLFFLLALLSAGSYLWAPVQAEEPAAEDAEAAAERERTEEYYELFELFIDTVDQVERNYVKQVDRRDLMEAAIRGVITKLDPYSNYIPPEDLERFRTSVESKFGGIGIQVSTEDGDLRVISPLYGTPAYKAGIQAGDVISEIEGESAKGITIDEAVERLKGEPGTKVNVTVRHPDGSEESLDVERKIIQVETVLGDHRKGDDTWDFMLDPELRIGYINITAFSRNTARDVRRALEELSDHGMRGLVLDLRFNPGGLLSSAIDISDLFISDGKIVSTKGRNTKEQVWHASKKGTFEGFPMVVLVNRYSASASEIVSACLQDHERAIVVGERSWGKGSVQNIVELEGGRSALKLTTAGYLRPSGKNIHRHPDDKDSDEWGVKPSEGYEVKLSNEQLIALNDFRREKGIIRAKVIAVDEEGEKQDGENKEGENKEGEKKEGGDASEDDKADDAAEGDDAVKGEPVSEPEAKDGEAEKTVAVKETFVDPQLQKAMVYLKEKLGASDQDDQGEEKKTQITKGDKDAKKKDKS